MLLVGFCGHAQNNQSIELLKKQWNTAAVDSIRQQLSFKLGTAYMGNERDSALLFLNRSLQIAQKLKDKKATVRSLQKIAYLYVYYFHDDEKALAYIQSAISMATPINDYIGLARCYEILTVITWHQKENRTDGMIDKAIEYAGKSGDWKIRSDMYNLQSYFHLIAKRYKQAEEGILKAIQISKPFSTKRWLSFTLDYCDVLASQGKSKQVEMVCRNMESALQNLEINSSEKDYVYFNDIARLQTKLKNYSKAEQIYLDILTDERLKSKPDTFHFLHVYRALVPNYLAENQYKKAFEAQTILTSLELFLSKKREVESAKIQMTKLQAAMDIGRKEQEIVVLEEQQKRQWLSLIASLIVSALLIGLVWFVFRAQRRISTQKEQLGELNATKSKILAILSHDLRAPIASLKNYMMLIDWGALSQDEFSKITQNLSNQVNNVQTMLDNTLHWSLSQMEGTKPTFEKVAPEQVITEQIALLEWFAKEKKIQIFNHVSADTQVIADKNHLAIIFRNLVHNALKFTAEGGHVVFDSAQNDDMLQICIIDDGTGMADTIIMELLETTDATVRSGVSKERGTGLGLVLVKNLVESNGGTLQVESPPSINNRKVGTRFLINFRQVREM